MMRSWADRMVEIKACSWYWGDLSWKDAERMLLLCDEGAFLLRDSRSENHLFTLSYRFDGKVTHWRIEKSAYSQLASISRDDTVVQVLEKLIQYTTSDSGHMLHHRRGGEAEATQLRLTAPLSRMDLLPRLQYLARLQLRKYFSVSELSSVRCPPALIDYIFDPKYIIPNIDDCLETLRRRKCCDISVQSLNL